jgi:predicted enzyme related to lactoylglutathione lyase
MIQAIHSVTLYVHNQTEAVRFYKEALGFEIRRWEPLGPAGSWIEMGPPGAPTCVVLYPRAMMPDADNRKGFVILDCADITASHEGLSARGVNFIQEPTSLGWGMFAVFTDLDGNELGLLQVTRAATVPGRASRPPGAPPPPPPPPPKKA